MAPPAPRRPDEPQVKRGEALFAAAKACSACHRPALETGDDPDPALAPSSSTPIRTCSSTTWARGSPTSGRSTRPAAAAGARHRSGVSVLPRASAREFLLHDGRARGPAEAILWHGGEAAAAREAFRRMSREERAALVAFLEQL